MRSAWGGASAAPLSGGIAPASFKGFAAGTQSNLPRCGENWSTTPGNSSDPPRSVPGYMAVIVSSVIGKSGRSISGNTRAVVIVKSDPGFGQGSRNQGTGIVVARICG